MWGQEKGERNASLLMAAPGSEEGRDTGRGGFNEGGAEKEGGGGGRQLGPSALWKTHRLLWKTQDVGMQAGRTGLDIPPTPPPSAAHTHTHTIPFSPFLS